MYSSPEVDEIWLWVYYNKIPIDPIFYVLNGDYIWSSQPPPNRIPPMICFKRTNSHRDELLRGRHPRNCRRCWCLKASILVTVVTVGPSCCRQRFLTVPTVTGIGVVLITILRTVVTFGPLCFFLSRFGCHQQSSGIRVVLILYKPSVEP